MVSKDGKYRLIDSGALPEAVAASAAIPFVFEPVDIPGQASKPLLYLPHTLSSQAAGMRCPHEAEESPLHMKLVFIWASWQEAFKSDVAHCGACARILSSDWSCSLPSRRPQAPSTKNAETNEKKSHVNDRVSNQPPPSKPWKSLLQARRAGRSRTGACTTGRG